MTIVARMIDIDTVRCESYDNFKCDSKLFQHLREREINSFGVDKSFRHSDYSTYMNCWENLKIRSFCRGELYYHNTCVPANIDTNMFKKLVEDETEKYDSHLNHSHPTSNIS